MTTPTSGAATVTSNHITDYAPVTFPRSPCQSVGEQRPETRFSNCYYFYTLKPKGSEDCIEKLDNFLFFPPYVHIQRIHSNNVVSLTLQLAMVLKPLPTESGLIDPCLPLV